METPTNWNCSVETCPKKVVTPATEQELIDVVKDVALYPTPVRAAGHLHSVNPCFAADGGTQVLMDGFKGVKVNEAARTITVGAGVTLLEISKALRQHKLELAVSPEIGNATAGSVACSGTKDSTLRPKTTSDLGQVGSAVVEVKLIDAAGQSQTFTELQQSQLLRAIRSSYGLLGLIYEVTFATVPLAPLQYEYVWLPIKPLPDIDRDIFAGADGVLAFLQPYRERILVERRTRDSDPRPCTNDPRRAFRDWVWQWGASEMTTLATVLTEALQHSPVRALERALARTLRRRFLGRMRLRILAWIAKVFGVSPDLLSLADFLPEPVFDLLEGFRAYRSDSMIDFSRDRSTYFDFSFWAYPWSEWRQIVPDYLEFCDTYRRNTGFRPSLFTEVYFICEDRQSLLSFSPKEPVFTLDIVDHRPWDRRWHELLRAYNEWAADHGGRPLLNQTKQLEFTPQVVSQAFGSDWKSFVAIVHNADPKGRLVNDFFRKLGV